MFSEAQKEGSLAYSVLLTSAHTQLLPPLQFFATCLYSLFVVWPFSHFLYVLFKFSDPLQGPSLFVKSCWSFFLSSTPHPPLELLVVVALEFSFLETSTLLELLFLLGYTYHSEITKIGFLKIQNIYAVTVYFCFL